MSETKRNDYQRELDKQFIKKWLILGNKTQFEITDLVNKRYKKAKIDIELSRSQIAYDIAELLKELEAEGQKENPSLKRLQEQRAYFIVNEAYNAWERSKKNKEKETTKSLKAKDYKKAYELAKDRELNPNEIVLEITNITEGQVGDPRFLQIMESAFTRIDRLNGLYPSPKEEENSNQESKSVIRVVKMPSNGRDSE